MLKSILNRPKQLNTTSQGAGIFPRRVAGTLVTDETALTHSAVYLAVKIISESIAALPSDVYQRKPGTQDNDVLTKHPLKRLLIQPNTEMTGFNFFRTILGHAALGGNGYAYIGRDRSSRPGELILISPERVNKGRSKVDGRIIYEISNGTSANSYETDDNMFHLPGMGFDGLTGYSVVSLARRTIGQGIASDEFGNSFYENGAQLGTIIEVPPELKLDEDGKNELIRSFDEKYKGVKHHHKTAIIDGGMKATSLAIPQKDAQFIESRKFNIIDVARWFNMPPHKLKDLDNATFSNIEEQNIDFVQDTLLPWIVNTEQTINWKMIGRNNTSQFVKLNLNGLLRGDSAARAAYYRERFNMGSLSINEIKAFEGENGIGPIGDKYFMQGAMSTVDRIVEPPEPPAPVMPAALPPGDDDQGDDEAPAVNNLERFRPLIESTVSKIVFNIDERIARTIKKGDAENEAQALPIVLNDRHEYIENTITPVVFAMVDVDRVHITGLVDVITEGLENGERDDLTGAVIHYCATISKTQAVSDE